MQSLLSSSRVSACDATAEAAVQRWRPTHLTLFSFSSKTQSASHFWCVVVRIGPYQLPGLHTVPSFFSQAHRHTVTVSTSASCSCLRHGDLFIPPRRKWPVLFGGTLVQGCINFRHDRVHLHVKCGSEHAATADVTRKFPRRCYTLTTFIFVMSRHFWLTFRELSTHMEPLVRVHPVICCIKWFPIRLS